MNANIRLWGCVLVIAGALACGGSDGSKPGSDGGTTTGPGNLNGCQITGTWGATHTISGGTTMTVALDGAGHQTFDRTGGSFPDAHVTGTYSYDVSSGQLTLVNQTVSTSDSNFDACIGVVGTYAISFPDCTHFTMSKVSDACSVRTQWADGATINKE